METDPFIIFFHNFLKSCVTWLVLHIWKCGLNCRPWSKLISSQAEGLMCGQSLDTSLSVFFGAQGTWHSLHWGDRVELVEV